ncbi:unnamed protein product, partial [Adineta steineri]
MRRNGAGKRLTYVDRDSRLLVWYRQKRTDPGSTTTPVAVFVKKNQRLSLQRPKRQQKFPLAEVHQKATSFYNYLRRASRWAPKRGPMRAFTPRDVLNMDESPLALFGDQAKRSIN